MEAVAYQQVNDRDGKRRREDPDRTQPGEGKHRACEMRRAESVDADLQGQIEVQDCRKIEAMIEHREQQQCSARAKRGGENSDQQKTHSGIVGNHSALVDDARTQLAGVGKLTDA